MRPTILWLRNDLRLADHPALSAALARGAPVLPVFVESSATEGAWAPGAASRWWLHHSLSSLDRELRVLGSRLVLRQGEPEVELGRLARESRAQLVCASRGIEPRARAAEEAVRCALAACDAVLELHEPNVLFDPAESERPARVFTPFWKRCLSQGLRGPARPAPATVPAPESWPASVPLGALGLLPTTRWDEGLARTWSPGRAGAERALRAFLSSGLDRYAEARDLPGIPGTSRLSPHLHFGEIGVREVVAACRARRAETFLSEIGWREFAHHLLWHFPDTPDRPLRPEFEGFAWRDDPEGLVAWQRGRTGYPLVDAAMRELWETGWMHNRARMVVASFLVKDLRIPWLRGAEWFWDTLVDADLANNTLGWQWTAGCGADAAPYFRIFNPKLQGERFDPEGAYVRTWVPELAQLPDRWIHDPGSAPEEVLRVAGVRLGETYPHPIVEHGRARREALAAYEAMREGP